MNLIKQVLNEIKLDFKKSFLIGFSALATMYICNLIPVISAYLMGISFLVFAFAYYSGIHKKNILTLNIFKTIAVPSALGGAFLVPSVFMMGTGMSLVNNSNNDISMASLGLALFLLSIYFLICAYIALVITTTENKNYLKSLDEAFNSVRKNSLLFFGFALALP